MWIVYEPGDIRGRVVTSDSENLRRALRRMPVPEPRPGFVDRAFAAATGAESTARRVPARRLSNFLGRWETWAGAALGGAVAAAITLLLLRPLEPSSPQPAAIALVLNETREIDMLIDSERHLQDATIRIAAKGSIALSGFENEPEIDWQADLERGSNLLSLPVLARAPGRGQLVATIEHAGRTRRVTIDINVLDPVSRS